MRCERGATPALAGGAREAACSVHGSDFDTFGQSAACGLARRVGFCEAPFRATDFHELRQDFNPPIRG